MGWGLQGPKEGRPHPPLCHVAAGLEAELGWGVAETPAERETHQHRASLEAAWLGLSFSLPLTRVSYSPARQSQSCDLEWSALLAKAALQELEEEERQQDTLPDCPSITQPGLSLLL